MADPRREQLGRTVIVQRWKRHGNDRAYVKVDNVQVGYRDVITTQVHCLDESHRGTIEAATEHLIRNRGNSLTAPDTTRVQAGRPRPVEPASTQAQTVEQEVQLGQAEHVAQGQPVVTDQFEGEHTGSMSTPYVARHIDPRYAPAGSAAHLDAAPQSAGAVTPSPARSDSAAGRWRRWLHRG